MATPGQTIYNCITTDLVTFLETRQSSRGALLKFATIHQPSGLAAQIHCHPFQEETIRVGQGTVAVTINRKKHILVESQQIVIPPNTPHSWQIMGEKDLKLTTEMRPALHFEEILETLACLSQLGKMSYDGNPDIAQWSATMNAYYGEFRQMGMPFMVHRFLYGYWGKILRTRFGFSDYLKFDQLLSEKTLP